MRLARIGSALALGLVLQWAACVYTSSDGDGDVDSDVDADVDADSDVDVDSDGDADAAGDADRDTDAVGDGDPDGEVAPTCGDEDVMAAYDACVATTGAEACVATGGTWSTASGEPSCRCPTSQGPCPCAGPAECLFACIADPYPGRAPCLGVTEGHCAPFSVVEGCQCVFAEDGSSEHSCD